EAAVAVRVEGPDRVADAVARAEERDLPASPPREPLAVRADPERPATVLDDPGEERVAEGLEPLGQRDDAALPQEDEPRGRRAPDGPVAAHRHARDDGARKAVGGSERPERPVRGEA